MSILVNVLTALAALVIVAVFLVVVSALVVRYGRQIDAAGDRYFDWIQSWAARKES